MDLLTTKEAARMLRVTRQTVARMIADGRITASPRWQTVANQQRMA